MLCYHLYGFLSSLPVPDRLWQEITMDFIVKLPLSKHKSNIYNSVLMMMNWYIKMIWYLSINVIIKFYKLNDLLIKKIFFYNSDTFIDIILNKNSVFISDYWSELCYHIKIKQ